LTASDSTFFSVRFMCAAAMACSPPPTRSVAGSGRGWGASRRALTDRRLDDSHNAVDIFQHVIVPKAQYAITTSVQEIGSNSVRRAVNVVTMLPTSDLDDHS
jgi:hypothetical protein